MTQEVNDINDALAINLEGLRRKRGLTFDQLAKLSGVSKGMLVQIEQGKTNPSINTLWRIANTFNVSVAKLIEIDITSTNIKTISEDEATELWQGPLGSSAKLLMGLDDKNLVEFWRWRLLPGHKHVSKAHISGAMELVYILNGELLLSVDGTKKTLNAGETSLFSADKPHSYENAGAEKLTFIMVVIEPGNS
jgi:transcriptional regulator with XRE-family HTH domain